MAKDEGFLSAWADALVESAQRLNQVFKWCPDPDLFNWIRLGRALEYLTTAREVAKKENISRIDVARGDIEMMRFTMSYLSGKSRLSSNSWNMIGMILIEVRHGGHR